MLLLVLLLSTGDVMANGEIVDCFAQVLARSEGPRRPESAAFLVLRRGRFDCVSWPFGGELNAARYRGKIPDGTVAIIHTHPDNDSEPSRQDMAEAGRLGVPVYVVTRAGVTVASPSQGRVAITRDRSWWTAPAPLRTSR